MDERGGIWSPLSNPFVYEAFQHLVGARRWLKRFVRETVQARPGERLLDIGCGPAALLRYLPEGVCYVGFDRNEAYIGRARRAYGERGQFVCDDVANFRKHGIAPVDIAVAIGLLHHVNDTLALHVLDAVRAILKPGGRLITVDPSLYEAQNPIAKAAIKLDRGRHLRSPDELRELCETVGRARLTLFGNFPYMRSICTVEVERI